MGSYAQYDKPYRLTYQNVSKSYLILNRGNGTVIEMDSNFKTKTVITGLKDPRDIQFAAFGGNQGVLIIDDNKLKIFDASSYNPVINFSIGNSLEAEGIAFDLQNAGVFYVSDIGDNKIIEGTVGPAPFYVPTFKVLTDTGLHRPRGMYFDNKNRLLLVSDSLNSPIQHINLTNGSHKVLMQTGLDSCHSITQDLEGNFYLTNWGDDYIYRIDPDFKSKKRIAGFNNPSGMYLNGAIDLLITCCTNCNKIEFQKLHWFEPLSDLRACEGDSLIMSVSPIFNGIGTFRSGNRFIVQMSDSNGSFTNSVNLGYVVADTNPKDIKIHLPRNIKNSHTPNTHLYRIRSTNPSHFSTSKTIIPDAIPNAQAYAEDSVGLCLNTRLSLGVNKEKNVQYTWIPSSNLSNAAISNPVFNSTTSGTFDYAFRAVDKNTGCSDSSGVSIEVNADIKLANFDNYVEACIGDTLRIGLESSPYAFKWQPSTDLSSDSSINPLWSARQSQTYKLELSDSITGCTGVDSVNVEVNALPVLDYLDSEFSVCTGDSVEIGTTEEKHPDFLWLPTNLVNDSISRNPKFSAPRFGDFRMEAVVTDSNGCINSTYVFVKNLPLPTIGRLSAERDTPEIVSFRLSESGLDSVELWMANSNEAPGTFLSILREGTSRINVNLDHDYFYLIGTDSNGCTAISERIFVPYVGSTPRPGVDHYIYVYPNPSSGEIYIRAQALSQNTNISILDVNGKRVLNQTISSLSQSEIKLDISGIENGVYFIQIIGDSIIANERVIIQNSK